MIEYKKYVYDIIGSIEEIEEFINYNNYFEFIKDIKTKRAVERNIEIIGEAMNKLIKIDETLPISNSRKIIDTRNRIIHGYDTVSDEILWAIVQKYLPVLKKELYLILNK